MVFSALVWNKQSMFLGEKCHWWQAEQYCLSPRNMLCMWNYFVNHFTSWAEAHPFISVGTESPALMSPVIHWLYTVRNTQSTRVWWHTFTCVSWNFRSLFSCLSKAPFLKAAMGWNPPLQDGRNIHEEICWMSCSTTRGFILRVSGQICSCASIWRLSKAHKDKDRKYD